MTKKEWEHTHIELCDVCGGAGIIYVYNDLDIIQQREPKEAVCRYCNGAGRIIKSGVIITDIWPFEAGIAARAALIKKKYESTANSGGE